MDSWWFPVLFVIFVLIAFGILLVAAQRSSS